MGMTKAEETKALEANIDISKCLARKYRTYGVEVADLEQEALIGVLTGIRKWTPEGGASVRSMAFIWGNHAVRKAVGYTGHGLTSPARKDASLDAELGDDMGTLYDVLASSSESPEEIAIRNERVQITLDAMEALAISPSEVEIVRKSLIQDVCLGDVGNDIGLKVPDVRQMRAELVELVASVAGAAA